jgi:serine/threonine protein kinase
MSHSKSFMSDSESLAFLTRPRNLPLSAPQWQSYFNYLAQYLSKSLPLVSYGRHKYSLVMSHIEVFRVRFCETHRTTVSRTQADALFHFFKAVGALIALIPFYSPATAVGHFLSHPVNRQYTELAVLWRAWSYAAATLRLPAFEDDQPLYQAHLLDIRAIHAALGALRQGVPEPYRSAIERRMGEIVSLIGLPRAREEPPTPAIITHANIRLVKEIGAGNFAVVRLAKLLPSDQDVAVKEMKAVQLSKRNLLNLKRELHTLLAMRHPNLLGCIGVTITPPFSIVTQFLKGGCLFDAIRGKQLSPTMKMQYAVGIARGLEYMAIRRYVHRDMKTQNILLDGSGNAIIADFGMARLIGPKMTGELGTVQWCAPEILEPKANAPGYDCSVDTYSFGIILWELLTGQIPYMNRRQCAAAALVARHAERPVLPENPSTGYIAVMTGCWAQEPKKRLPMETVRSKLESGNCCLPETDVPAFLKWVQATRAEHEQLIDQARAEAAREELRVLDLVHTIGPLDPTALTLLHELCQLNFPFSERLLGDLLALSNQTLRLEVQEAAFDLLKRLVIIPDPSGAWDRERILAFTVPLFEGYPQGYVKIVALLADGVDVERVINFFLSLPKSHSTAELLQAVIGPNAARVSMETVLCIPPALDAGSVTAFFRFLMATFGPRPEFVAVAVSNVQLATMYTRELGRLPAEEYDLVKGLLGLPDVGVTPGPVLEEVAAALIDQQSAITPAAATVVLHFLVANCLRYNVSGPLVKYLLLCSSVPELRPEIARFEIWGQLYYCIDTDREAVFELLQRLPLPSYAYGVHFLGRFLQIFIENHSQSVAAAMATILSQSDNFPVDQIVQVVRERLMSDEPLLALVIMRGFSPAAYAQLEDGNLWPILTRHLGIGRPDVIEALMRFVLRLLSLGESFPFDPDFFAMALNICYAPQTPFAVCKELIAMLMKASVHKGILVFLEKRYFGSYLMQLPWIYPNDSAAVFETLESCATQLSLLYPAAT